MPTLEDLKIDKQALEGNIINIVEDFIDKYHLQHGIVLDLIRIQMLGCLPRYDVQVKVKL